MAGTEPVRPERSASTAHGPELSIVVPTFCERANVVPLLAEVERALPGIRWELIFVDDDSHDGTSDEVRRVAQSDSRVRGLHRIGRRGLTSACVEGMLSSSAPYLAVMDGDLQHDPSVLPRMLELLRKDEAEIVVGSRYTDGGGIGDWDAKRAAASRFATTLGRLVLRSDLSDPMSGFFMLRRIFLLEVVSDLSGLGFKILLDIFASAGRPVAFREIPFQFRVRQQGESKLDAQVAWDYLMLLADKTVGRYVPVRFVSFAFIGSLGIGVHFLVLSSLYLLGHQDFVFAQSGATFVAMIFNFALNNALTYRDRRLTGFRWFGGLASFMVACSVGAIASVGVAAYLFKQDSKWAVAAIAGVLAGSVWNYAVTSFYTWGGGKRR